MRKQSRGIKKLVLSAMFMAIGLVLPFITGQIQQIGNMLLPMHIPVLFCGLICGWQYGAVVGFVLPLLRYVLFGMPPIFPTGVSMSFELAVYGAVIGLNMQQLGKRNTTDSGKNYVRNLYLALIGAMLAGRIVWGLVRFILARATMQPFTMEMFMAGAFLTAIPGIIVQLILIPGIMAALKRVGVLNADGTCQEH
jgi:riboflavin transporter FmnP